MILFIIYLIGVMLAIPILLAFDSGISNVPRNIKRVIDESGPIWLLVLALFSWCIFVVVFIINITNDKK